MSLNIKIRINSITIMIGLIEKNLKEDEFHFVYNILKIYEEKFKDKKDDAKLKS